MGTKDGGKKPNPNDLNSFIFEEHCCSGLSY